MQNRLIIFLSFLLLSFLTYRYFLIGVPRFDQIRLGYERILSENDWDFFLKSVSYDRTRVFNPGNYYLFRPGTTSLLALLDIFLPTSGILLGSISIILHAIFCFSIFIVLSLFQSQLVSILVSLLFLFQYSGLELIDWRHLSPYILSLIFFNGGIYFWFKKKENKDCKTWLIPQMFFFVSTLFHEITAITLFLCWVILRLLRPHQKSTYGRLFLLPPVVYASLNLINFFYHHPPSIFGPASVSFPSFEIWSVTKQTFAVCGVFAMAFFMPYLFQFGLKEDGDLRTKWIVSGLSSEDFFWLGIITLMLSIVFAKKIKHRLNKLTEPMILYASFFFILVTGITVGRVYPWKWRYFEHSSYYFYFSNFLICVLIGFFFRSLYLSLIFKSIVLIFTLVTASLSYFCIQKRGKEIFKETSAIWATTKTLNSFFKLNPSYCYGGTVKKDLETIASPDFLYRESCLLKKLNPLYLTNSNEKFLLISLKSDSSAPEPHSIEIPRDSDKSKSFYKSNNISFLKTNKPPSLISVTIHNPNSGGLIFGFTKPDNFSLYYVVEARALGLMTFENGDVDFSNQIMTVPNTNPTELKIVQWNHRTYLFKNNMMFERLEGSLPSGKVGWMNPVNKNSLQFFSELKFDTFEPKVDEVFALDVKEKRLNLFF